MSNHKIYNRENYLSQIRSFYKSDLIKVLTGIRRAGKSCVLQSVISELREQGIPNKDIIYLPLDSRGYKNIRTPEQLETAIAEQINDDNFKYLFIDEIQNVRNFEPVINAFREDGQISIFITGSNSYFLSGELMTKLTGRYVEFEIYPLNFFEYINMKNFLGKSTETNIYAEFQTYLADGGFPGALMLDDYQARMHYVSDIITQIIDKDVKRYRKIKDKESFELVQKFVINNFGAVISISSIHKHLTKNLKVNIDRRTISRYLEILINSKIIYPCELFDIKSKNVFRGERKYYLADISIYNALNVNAKVNYGAVLENLLHNYLRAKQWKLSVGRIGKLECDFIARYNFDKYVYIQVSQTIADPNTENREYKSFYEIRDSYPKYLFTTDMLLQHRDGVTHLNIIDFMSNNQNI